MVNVKSIDVYSSNMCVNDARQKIIDDKVRDAEK